jgi:O-acetyl-ADP-ribose deacetylase (regulator of RNase III)
MIIELIRGDITQMEVDVIVNAANTSLLGGGGVDGAIHKAGGRAILDDCLEIRYRQGGCRVGEAVITTAGRLKAQKVIHTVGPRWNGGISDEVIKLRNCYINSIKLAEEYNLRTIAFPNISTGIYKFPKQKAAEIAIDVINNLESDIIERVIFVCYDERNYEIYKAQLEEL